MPLSYLVLQAAITEVMVGVLPMEALGTDINLRLQVVELMWEYRSNCGSFQLSWGVKELVEESTEIIETLKKPIKEGKVRQGQSAKVGWM